MKFLTFLMKKISIYIAIGGVLLGIILIKIIGKEDSIPPPIALPATNPFQNSIAASGIVESLDRNISVGTPVSGVIKNLYVKVGDKVAKDALLFQIDDRDLQANLLVQKANLEVSKANLKRLEDQLERLKSVHDSRAVTADDVKTRQNDVAIALAQYKAAESQIKQSEILIERLNVRAPKEGTILQVNTRNGEYEPLNDTTPPILLGDLSRLQVRVDIDEQSASHFSNNLNAFAYPKNNTTLKIPLEFNRVEPYVIPKISFTGSSDERVDTRVLQVIYTFEEPKDFRVYVGQQMDVFIEIEADMEPK
jgi:HlyD family secretion protein